MDTDDYPRNALVTDALPRRWRRKTAQERRASAKRLRRGRLNPVFPLLTAAVFSAAVTAARVFGGGGGRAARWPTPPVPLGEALMELPVVFLGMFLFFYALQLLGAGLGGIVPLSRALICPRCHELAANASTGRCPCGGEYEDADLWTRDPPGGPPGGRSVA